MKDYIAAFLGLFAGILFIVMTLTAFAHVRKPEPPQGPSMRFEQPVQVEGSGGLEGRNPGAAAARDRSSR